MVLYKSSILSLDYHPASDIMEVDYPDLDGFVLSEVRNSLTLMVDTIRHYDVKKLLLDASKTVITISEEENRELTLRLAADLAKTRLQKVARIQPVDSLREVRAQQNIERAREAGLLPYELKTFGSKEDALAWLVSPI